MSKHYRFSLNRNALDYRVYALAALLAYELPHSLELAALNTSRDIVWG